MRGQISSDSCKICPCFLHILFCHRNGYILFLRNAVSACGFIQKHIVVFDTVSVQTVMLQRHKDGTLKIRLVQSVVVDRDLCGSSAVKAVQQLGVCQEHALLIFAACHKVVNIRELVSLGKLIPDLENAIRPDALDGDKVLNFVRNLELLFILRENGFNALYHCSCRPPFRVRR